MLQSGTENIARFVHHFKRRHGSGGATERARTSKPEAKRQRSDKVFEPGPPGLPQRPRLTEMDKDQPQEPTM
ncbi:unnamed protein product [Chrysoparadoxa australica]